MNLLFSIFFIALILLFSFLVIVFILMLALVSLGTFNYFITLLFISVLLLVFYNTLLKITKLDGSKFKVLLKEAVYNFLFIILKITQFLLIFVGIIGILLGKLIYPILFISISILFSVFSPKV